MIGARHSVLGDGRGRWPGLAANRRRAAGRSLGISTSSDHPGRCGALDHLRHSPWVLTCLLATAAIAVPPAPAWSQAQPGGSSRPADEPRRTSDRPPPSYFVILNAPADFDALLQKIRQPDLEVRPIATGATAGDGAGAPAGRVAPAGWVVESVKVRGRVRGDSAILKVELTIVTAADDPTWVPIRLDDQRLIGAGEGARALDLRIAGAGRWQVELVGQGTHRVEVDLRCPLMTRPARAALSLAIPEAPSTSLELDFDRRETDLIVGANEDYGQASLPDGKGSRLSAHLTPRPRVEVSWAVETKAPDGIPRC